MYQVKILREIEESKTVLILPGEPLLNKDGSETGDLNETEVNVETVVQKTSEELLAEEEVILQEKEDEVQAKVDAYADAIANQLENGGPGPVAEFEIMKIVNEHEGEFEIIFKEE